MTAVQRAALNRKVTQPGYKPSGGARTPRVVRARVSAQPMSQPPGHARPPSEIVPILRQLLIERTPLVDVMRSTTQRFVAFVARSIGTAEELGASDRKALYARADRLLKAAAGKTLREQPTESDQQHIQLVAPMAMAWAAAIAPVATHRAAVEKAMRQYAMALPVWPVVEPIAGLGALGLAILVGHAGALGDYRGPACLWKRFGVACLDGEAQRRVAGDAEKAIRMGFDATRRAAIYNATTALIMAGSRALKTHGPSDQWATETQQKTVAGPSEQTQTANQCLTVAGPSEQEQPETHVWCFAGPAFRILPTTFQHPRYFRDLFDARRAYENARTDPGKPKSKMHALRRAQRHVSKRLLRVLWQAWRETEHLAGHDVRPRR